MGIRTVRPHGLRSIGPAALVLRRQLATAGGLALLISGGFVIAATAAQAATNTYYVGVVGDSAAAPPSDCTSATNTDCTLRQAIKAANADGGTDTILFSSLPTPSTITLTAGNGPLSVNDAGTLAITGQGASNTVVDGAGGTQVFSIAGGTTTITGLTIQNGDTSGVGGGISSSGALTVSQVVVHGNTANEDGGIFNASGATMTIASSTISGNTAVQDTGGIDNEGTLTITSSTFSGNTSHLGCGGIRNDASMTLTGSTVSGNHAATDGAGVCSDNSSGQMTLTNDTIANNVSATGNGGGLADSNVGSSTLASVTIADNTASGGHGGGIFYDSTNGSNPTGPFTIKGSILDGNVVGTSTASPCSGSGTVTSSGYNVIGPQADSAPCTFGAVGDKTNTSSGLGSLANNGGPTQTMAISSGSPAQHVEPVASCPSTDQRGVSRPQPASSATCDAGAFELAVASNTTTTTPTPAVPGATTPHTGEPWSGSAPFIAVLLGAGVAMLGLGVMRRRRSRA